MEWKLISTEKNNKLNIITEAMAAGNGVIVRTIIEGEMRLVGAPIATAQTFVPHAQLVERAQPGTYRIEFKP